jgi:hypothetical protein
VTLLDNFPPESISDAVTTLLQETVAAAVENWGEGFWSDFDQNISKADVLRYFTGYIDALLDGDPEEYSDPLLKTEDDS